MTHAPADGGGSDAGSDARAKRAGEEMKGKEEEKKGAATTEGKQVVQLMAPSVDTEDSAEESDDEVVMEMAKRPASRGGHAHHPHGPSGGGGSSMPTPPDGGWGWVVVFASFMIHVVNDGVTYSFGIFYDALITYFDSGRGETAWILSILVGVTLCSGPISSSFVNKYGCRPVTIAGALLGAGSFALSVFAPNVQTLYLTIGLGTGFGFGLVYLPAIVSVTCYFERLRSLATGIAVCGSGLGTFALAPITKMLVDNLGWRYSIVVVSGLILSCAGFGALFRPVPTPPEQLSRSNSSVDALRPHAAAATTDLSAALEKTPPLHASERDLSGGGSFGGRLHRPRSVGHLSAPRSGAMRSDSAGGPATRLARSQPALLTTHDTRFYGATPMMIRKSSGLMYRKDILYSGSVRNLPAHEKSTLLLHQEAAHLLAEEEEVVATLTPPLTANGQVSGDTLSQEQTRRRKRICGCGPEGSDAIKEMLNFSLLKDPIFIIFTVSNFLTSIGYNVPYLYVAVAAKARGLDDNRAGWLLAAIGFANTIGRIVLGYISDKPWVNRLLVYNLCLTVCGVATAMSIMCSSYTSFLIYSCVFGVSIGAYVGLTSVVLVDLLGLDKLTNAFGLLLLFQGFASLLGPPVAGWLYDATGSYSPGFLTAGITMGISGAMLYVIPPMQRRIALRNKDSIEMKPANGAASAHAFHA